MTAPKEDKIVSILKNPPLIRVKGICRGYDYPKWLSQLNAAYLDLFERVKPRKITSHLDPVFFDNEKTQWLKTDREQQAFGEGINEGVRQWHRDQ
jgi:hypothetical protein